MRVQLPSKVATPNIDPSLINIPNNLNIIRRPHVLHALEGTLRNKTRSFSGFRAPSDGFMLNIADHGVAVWRCEKAEVVEVVQERSLAT